MDYGAKQIQVLEGLDPVRKRPSMYIGSTGPDGLHHLVYELVDNCLDEALAGYCNRVLVFIEPEGSVSVEDNGRGIPVDMHPSEGVSALEVVMTKLHAGGKFDKAAYKVSGGLHGVGVSVVNALSRWCQATVYQNNHTYFQSFQRGVPDAPLAQQGDCDKRGTMVRFMPDEQIFESRNFSFDILSMRLRELAFLNKGITIELEDQRPEHEQRRSFTFNGGLSEFVLSLNKGKGSLQPSTPIYFEKERDGVVVEFAAQYNESYSETVFSYANNINTREGGSHLSGMRAALTRVMNDALRSSPRLQKKSEDSGFSGEDCREGLTAIISVKVPEPQFEGQTKAKLGNSEVRGIVDSQVYEQLQIYFESHPAEQMEILEKAMTASRARAAARKARELTRRKSFLDNASLPGKLADCSSKDPERSEVFIVEGDAAGGSAKSGRDRATQAILPLWGKMLNTERTRFDKVLGNDKLLPIMSSLGAGVGDDFDTTKLRYHKVIIMADADSDGSHIRCLLLTFFVRYMRPLVEGGFVFLAMPPLYRLEKGSVIRYSYDEKGRDLAYEDLKASGNPNGRITVSRYKGLGEMNPEQLWETTMDPDSRTLRKVTMDDFVAADSMFTILMGEDVPPRRQFIEDNALKVSFLDV